jgi:hypothetical protein
VDKIWCQINFNTSVSFDPDSYMYIYIEREREYKKYKINVMKRIFKTAFPDVFSQEKNTKTTTHKYFSQLLI